MKAELDVAWLPKNFTSGFGTIKEITEVTHEGKKDRQITCDIDNRLYKFSVYGTNWNRLISKWGHETDLWIGQVLHILREEPINGRSAISITPR